MELNITIYGAENHSAEWGRKFGSSKVEGSVTLWVDSSQSWQKGWLLEREIAQLVSETIPPFPFAHTEIHFAECLKQTYNSIFDEHPNDLGVLELVFLLISPIADSWYLSRQIIH